MRGMRPLPQIPPDQNLVEPDAGENERASPGKAFDRTASQVNREHDAFKQQFDTVVVSKN